jgi:hypothetical protein
MASDGDDKLQRRQAEGDVGQCTTRPTAEHAIWRSQVKLKGVAGDMPRDMEPDMSISRLLPLREKTLSKSSFLEEKIFSREMLENK